MKELGPVGGHAPGMPPLDLPMNLSLTSMVHEWVMLCALVLMFLVMICSLMVLLSAIITETDENEKHQRKLQHKRYLQNKTSVDSPLGCGYDNVNFEIHVVK